VLAYNVHNITQADQPELDNNLSCPEISHLLVTSHYRLLQFTRNTHV